jgi:hypothetical protein
MPLSRADKANQSEGDREHILNLRSSGVPDAPAARVLAASL